MSIHYGVIGTGPVGRVFAGLLRQAGHRVSVLAHRAQTQQILQRRPVVVKGKLEAYAQLQDVVLETGDFVRAAPDVVLLCTKSVDSEHVLRTLREHAPKPGMLFVSCQNGIGTERAAHLGHGCCSLVRRRHRSPPTRRRDDAGSCGNDCGSCSTWAATCPAATR